MTEYIISYFPILESFGKKMFGDKFYINPNDKEVISKLLSYFTQDEKASKYFGIDLNKGILLNGSTGVGKTSLMKLMSRYSSQDTRFQMLNCRHISTHFGIEGPTIIGQYCYPDLMSQNNPNVCYDDLGAETHFNYYATSCRVMSEILLTRFDLFDNLQIKTHIISNLNINEIEDIYGQRLRSRFRKMVNLISFPINALDKRS